MNYKFTINKRKDFLLTDSLCFHVLCIQIFKILINRKQKLLSLYWYNRLPYHRMKIWFMYFIWIPLLVDLVYNPVWKIEIIKFRFIWFCLICIGTKYMEPRVAARVVNRWFFGTVRKNLNVNLNFAFLNWQYFNPPLTTKSNQN